MYPSISANPQISAGGAVENFYTGNAPQESYGRPQSTYYPPTQQQQYSVANKRASISNPGYPGAESYSQYPALAQQPPQQNAGNWQPNESSSTPTPANPGYVVPDQRVDAYSQSRPIQPQHTGSWHNPEATTQHPSQPLNYSGEGAPQQISPPANVPSQPPTGYAPTEQAPTPSADPNASFYYQNGPQEPPSQQKLDQTQSQYPPTQSPQLFHSTLPNQPPAQQFTQQTGNQQQAQPPQPPQPSQVRSPYWQNQQQAQAPQQSWQAHAPAPAPTYSGYTQDSFPSAPHHAPQQKVMEESLIEL